MSVVTKIILTVSITAIIYSCNQNYSDKTTDELNSFTDSTTIANKRMQIDAMLDSFNIAAANADYNNYFDYFTDDAVFMGTDATEHWDKKSFMIWAKPYFDRGKAWSFTAMQRHIYFNETGCMAWFDELLNTQMKICRGSGVLTKQGSEWKINQYVLSMTIPNSESDSVVSIKSAVEDSIIKSMMQK